MAQSAQSHSFSPDVIAYATHHDEPMLFPSMKEAAAYCMDDEQPIALINQADHLAEVNKLVEALMDAREQIKSSYLSKSDIMPVVDAVLRPYQHSAKHHALKALADKLEQTAMGDSYFGTALGIAREIDWVTDEQRAMLYRWTLGSQRQPQDRLALCDLAIQIRDSATGEK